jgi:hypothetical protein
MLETVQRYRIVFCQGFATPPHPLDKPGSIIGHVFGLLISRGTEPPGLDVPLETLMAWEDALGIQPDVLVKSSTEQLRKLWDGPAIIEATSASRARPAPDGNPFPDHPTVVSLRTGEDDASYRSVNMMLLDDRAYYFFSEPVKGKFVGGMNPSDIVLPVTEEKVRGIVGGVDAANKPVWILMKKADPSHKHGPDAEPGCIEACLTQQEKVYNHYHDIMEKLRTEHLPPSSPASSGSAAAAAKRAEAEAEAARTKGQPRAGFGSQIMPQYRTTARYFTAGKFKQVCY